jgi:hypothetical protein
VLYIGAALIIVIVAAVLLLRPKRTVVDDCVIWVSYDSHCTGIVHYREKRRTLRFAAEVGAPQGVDGFLWVDLPETMYTDAGDVVLPDEYEAVKQRVSRGLKQLGIAHELESAPGQSSRPE